VEALTMCTLGACLGWCPALSTATGVVKENSVAA
jgi:glycopeptide antibiotics resistance protein